ncbi:hypothetical protein [Streptomyces lasiicapitis]|uniref:Uncharacterized protein n=1 Tax=Streptomyces lasiicapitis TaxID=1923961 RepID=A0ABQ2MHX9_9ACTN|nr:hypothetical protein [Streptomyces lasiicapitis]GGO52906.1 hypothetical protein GCM10012286_59020 [Streptomyces lasiicapitis]
MDKAGDGPAGPVGAAEPGRRLVAELLAELNRKVAEAGAEHVRVVTDEEIERERARWFREGWRQHAGAAGSVRHEAGDPVGGGGHESARGAGHPDTEGLPGPPVRVPGVPGAARTPGERTPDERARGERARGVPGADPARPARVLRFPYAEDT